LNIENGGGRHLEIYKNHHISAADRGSSDFYEIWPDDTLYVHDMYEPQLSDFVRFWCIFSFCMVSFTRRMRITGGMVCCMQLS